MSDRDILSMLREQGRRIGQVEVVERPRTAEGSFTPTLVGSGVAGTFTYSAQFGAYTRVNTVLSFRLLLSITAITVAPTGNLTIAGLPIVAGTIGTGAGVAGGGHMAVWQGITLPAGYTQLLARVLAASTTINLTRAGSAVGQANVQGGELALVGGVANFEIQGQYQV